MESTELMELMVSMNKIEIEKLKEMSNDFKIFFEETIYLIDKMDGNKYSPPRVVYNICSISVRYKNLDMYIYIDKIIIYIDRLNTNIQNIKLITQMCSSVNLAKNEDMYFLSCILNNTSALNIKKLKEALLPLLPFL